MRVLLAPALALVAAALPGSALAADAQLVRVGDFASPVYAAGPPGDPSRLFVVERAGTVVVLRGDGSRATFLDAGDDVQGTSGESGLLSIAFAPDYATSGRFYLYVANHADNAIRILEFRRSAADPDAADSSTRRVVVEIPDHTANNHWGGTVAFGGDGRLYLAPGDNTMGNNAPNTGSLFGKLLRIAPATPGAQPEIVARGLRNPFRFAFDRANGDLAIGDVGDVSHEEVDFVPAAEIAPTIDFGWPRCEGLSVHNGPGPCNASSGAYRAPVLAYDRAPPCTSITGGVVIRDPALTTLTGRYVYADLCAGQLRSALLRSPSATDDGPVDVTGSPAGVSRPVGFGEDASGCVYVASLDAVSPARGTVYRLAPPGGPARCSGPAPPVNPAVRLSATGAARQPVLRQGGIRLRVRCSTACTVRGRGTVTVGKKRYKLPAASQALLAGRTAVLVVKLSKAARAAVGTALARGVSPLAALTVSAGAPDGTSDKESLRARLVR